MRLKYLFTAEYSDGTVHKQTPEDNSKLEPGVRSEFYDVLKSQKKVVRFTLRQRAVFRPRWLSVDLTTGEFTGNVPEQELHLEGDRDIPEISDRELIFYRQHQHELNRETHQEVAHRVTYCIGWQANVNGKNYKQIWGVK